MSSDSPVTPGRADHDDDEPEHEVERNDVADLRQLLRRHGEVAAVDGGAEAPPRREIEMAEGQHHDDADALHDVDVRADLAEAAEAPEDHAVAARQEGDNAQADHREEAGEDAPPQLKALRRLERPDRRAQHLMGEEHAAHPDDGGEDVKEQAKDHGSAVLA